MSDFSIPAGTRHLAVIVNAQNDTGLETSDIRFNGDTGASYNHQRLRGSGAVASAVQQSAMASTFGPEIASAANVFSGGMIIIPHYANMVNHKATLVVQGGAESSVGAVAGRWASASAITSVQIRAVTGNFVANSIFLLCAVDERFLVEEVLLSADGTVTFSTIPQLDGDLVVVGYCRGDRAGFATDNFIMTVNGDTTDANYIGQRVEGVGAAPSASGLTGRFLFPGLGADATANAFGAFITSISRHANGAKQPHYLTVGGYHESANSQITIANSRRDNIAAYTSLAFAPTYGTNFKSGSLFSLYFVPKRLIGYEKLTADKATITHTVPAGYEAIFPKAFARSDVVAATDNLVRSFNNDVTDTNYDTQTLTGDGGTVAAAQSTGSRVATVIPAVSAGANIFGGGIGMIPAYTETDRHKHALSIDGAADDIVALRSMRWESLVAITEIDETNGGNFEGN